MPTTFPKRLKAARVAAMLSQDKLVAAMDGLVSKNAIAKYERGEMMPNSKVLIAMAKALSVKPDYFFRPFEVEIKRVEFRKKSRLGQKKLNAIRQIVTDKVERYLEVEDLLNIAVAFENPLQDIVISKGEEVDAAVNQLLQAWQLGINALPNVIELLEDKGVKVVEIEAELAFDGLSGWANGNVPVIVVNKSYGTERKRFTALHELGHLLLSFAPSLEVKKIERLCHRFAGAMLIPEATFMEEFGEHRSSIALQELISAKETYGISVQALMARAKDLGVVSESTYVRFRKEVSRNREEKGWGQYIGKEQSDRFLHLVYRATTEGIISMSKAANLVGEKLAVFRKNFAPL